MMAKSDMRRLSNAMRKFIYAVCWSIGLGAAPAYVGAQPIRPASQPGAAGDMPPAAGDAFATSGTLLAQAARSIGIRRCYAAVDQVSRVAYARSQKQDVVLDWNRANADASPFFSLSGLEYPDASAVVSLATVPSGAMGGCSILVERISSAPLACAEVAKSELQGFHATRLVHAVMVYTNDSRQRETVTLIDAQGSCVIIRRQVKFDWAATP
ncbi:hypothetical protein LL999_22815 [Burkholderia ambifaria]|uniref:hypothetical protein n=1 Tax=Burkholderia ambifaria TaxID=152480 RepID=UPI001E39AE5F|nr:hypothetical protein [Burkholderia ambifaria]UEP23083.1 hypothetical protein LL999_22815 [Burkholderia ambifaria]UEP39828.1 hypothetical protein LL998_33370 [Burkholderia ambifaria]